MTMSQAIQSLRPQAEFVLVGPTLEGLDWRDESPRPTQAEIDQKMIELEAAEPIRLLREERNLKLAGTDWWASSDLVMSNDRQIYRQLLRDSPATASPTLDEFGQLSGVTWPEIPE